MLFKCCVYEKKAVLLRKIPQKKELFMYNKQFKV